MRSVFSALQRELIRVVVRVLVVGGVVGSGAAAHAQLATPTLNTPAHGATDWLFNLPTNGARQTLSWSTVSKATGYQIVVSSSANFSGLVGSAGATPACINSSCIVVLASAASAPATLFSNWAWEAGTYYWRVRAVNAVSWGPWSVTRSFTTTSRPAVARNALAYRSSPASIVSAPAGTRTTWETEISGGDGNRLISAMRIYRLSGLAGVPAATSTTFRQMDIALTNTDPQAVRNGLVWLPAERSALITQIALTRANYTRVDPANGQEAMNRLGVLAQCKEFADRVVAGAGGTNEAYSRAPAAGLNVRPGMYVFRYERGRAVHAAIANAVRFDSGGAVSARLSEANWGGGWRSNPEGQVPWLRTVRHDRWETITTNGEYRAHTN